jgi:hypothetical protein
VTTSAITVPGPGTPGPQGPAGPPGPPGEGGGGSQVLDFASFSGHDILAENHFEGRDMVTTVGFTLAADTMIMLTCDIMATSGFYAYAAAETAEEERYWMMGAGTDIPVASGVALGPFEAGTYEIHLNVHDVSGEHANFVDGHFAATSLGPPPPGVTIRQARPHISPGVRDRLEAIARRRRP